MSAPSRPSHEGPLRWSVLLHPPLSGRENMAWDHTLAEALPPDTAVLRLYEWSRPTLSLGRNEPARGRFHPDRLARAGVDLVRRPTGGRTVLHHRELTYAVCTPIRALGGVRAAYALLNRALAAGLAHLGAEVGVAGASPAVGPDAGPCFQAPAEGEVTAADRKLVGSAQVRMGGTLLQHGSILLSDDQSRIAALRSDGEDLGRLEPATLEGILGRAVSGRELRTAVLRGFSHTVPGHWRGVPEEPSFADHELPSDPRPDLLERYGSREWTWRR